MKIKTVMMLFSVLCSLLFAVNAHANVNTVRMINMQTSTMTTTLQVTGGAAVILSKKSTSSGEESSIECFTKDSGVKLDKEVCDLIISKAIKNRNDTLLLLGGFALMVFLMLLHVLYDGARQERKRESQ